MLSWQEHEKRFISPGQGIPVNFFSFPWVDKIKKIFISKNFNHVTKIYLPSNTLGWIKDFIRLIYRHGRGLLHQPTHLKDQDIPTLQHPWQD